MFILIKSLEWFLIKSNWKKSSSYPSLHYRWLILNKHTTIPVERSPWHWKLTPWIFHKIYTHTPTHIYIYICVCMCLFIYINTNVCLNLPRDKLRYCHGYSYKTLSLLQLYWHWGKLNHVYIWLSFRFWKC